MKVFFAQDGAEFQDLDSWAKAVFAKYPNAKRLKDGLAKVAFVNNQVVGKYTFGGTKAKHEGWVA